MSGNVLSKTYLFILSLASFFLAGPKLARPCSLADAISLFDLFVLYKIEGKKSQAKTKKDIKNGLRREAFSSFFELFVAPWVVCENIVLYIF